MNKPYGFTHGEYVETILVDDLHVYTPDVLITREIYRRYHTWPQLKGANKNILKSTIRSLIERHRENRQIVKDFNL